MDTCPSDEVLVQRFQSQRDEAAFRELLERHYPAVHRLSVSILGTRFASDADDVAQEVFLRVHHALPQFRGQSKFTTWLFRIAYNLALNTKQQVYSRRTRLDTGQHLASAPNRSTEGLDEADGIQLRRVLDAAIDLLPQEYQTAMRLHYWFGLSVSEVAMAMGMRENTIKSYMHRARKLLASQLDKDKENL